MTLSCKEISFGSDAYKTLLTIRYEVLRKPIGWELREKDIANDRNEFHLAAFDDATIIGCVLLKPLNASTVQLRQMAQGFYEKLGYALHADEFEDEHTLMMRKQLQSGP